MNFPLASRREALAGAVSIAATSIIIANKSASAASGVGGINAIPELAPQWKDLDLAEILTRPAAYMSVSQNKSLYDPGGVQAGEKHRERGSLPATVKVVTAARKVSVDVLADLAARSDMARKVHDSYAAFRDRTAAWSRISIKGVLDAREG